MPSDLPLSAEAEAEAKARKWRAYAAAEESAHAIVAIKLGFVPPDNLRLSIDPATPAFLGSGANTAAQHLGWHHLVRMWFDIQNAGCPTTAGRIAALEAVAMIAQAGPLATILMDPDAPDLTDRGWVLDGVWFFDITAAKSEAGIREVPVHSKLAWLLKSRPKNNHGQVCPDLKPGGPDGKHSHYYSGQFTGCRRASGIADGRKVFHSLRKNAVEC
jgi:hypothetical protein